MIVPCDANGNLLRCFRPGAEVVVPAAAVVQPAAPSNEPVDYSLWGSRGDMVGVVQYLAERQAAIAAAGRPGMDLARGTSKSVVGYTKSPNSATECLYREQGLWKEIEARGGLQGLCCPTLPKGVPPPWVAMPSSGRRFQQINSIVLPVVAGVDNLVTTFSVPTGYDGVIVSVVNMFTGTGFVEGSGDLHYRIQINRRWLKDYGDIQTTLGTVASPCMIYRGGVRLRTQEVVNYWVQVTAAGLGNLLPGGRIVCAFFGWFYPQV